jgi:ubiquinone/menaquinone biosynthesis C-methylase UbiE
MSKQVLFGDEVDATTERTALPAYAPMLAAFQRAHAGELQEMIHRLPVKAGDRVLDMACGNGVYSAYLAQRAGLVVGIDIAAAYLSQARARLRSTTWPERSGFAQGDIAALPCADNSFDMVWCAYSLYSLPDLMASLHELRRVLRPGGRLAVLENDTLHQVIIPWPARLELAVRRAQLAALEAENNATGKYFIGRQFRRAFAGAALQTESIRCYTRTRYAPLSDDERSYLTWYLHDLAERVRPYLDQAARDSFELLLKPDSELFLLDQPDFYVIYIDILALARKTG